MIHFSDVRDVIYDPTLRELITAYDLADVESPIVNQNTPLADLLRIFERYEVSLLPISEHPDSRVVSGIVDQRDVLRAAHREQAAP